MSLYHFTCLCHLPSILKDGLTRGQMPDFVSSPESPTPNLTSNPNREPHKVWSGSNNDDENSFSDKLRFRLTVEVPDLARLKPQRELWREQGISRKSQRAYDLLGQAKFWFIHFGTIPPSCITKIDEWNGTKYVQADLTKCWAEHDLYEEVQLPGFRLMKLKSEVLPADIVDRVRAKFCRAR